MMSVNNESGIPDPNKMRILQGAFDFNQGQAKNISDERNQLFQQKDSLSISYMMDLMRETKELLPLQIRVSNAIRRELNLECDSDEILSQMADEHLKQMTAQLDSLLGHLQGKSPITSEITPQA